jgi:type II secretory pathway pseudopilin PulG
MRDNSRLNSGRFTMIEVLAVILILTILLALIIGGTKLATGKASTAATLSRMKKLEAALEAYRETYGYYPPYTGTYDANMSSAVPAYIDYGFKQSLFGTDFLAETQTQDLLSGIPVESSYYNSAMGACFIDGFGQYFHYRYPGTHNPQKYDLWSKGPDYDRGLWWSTKGVTKDDPINDITNWRQTH